MANTEILARFDIDDSAIITKIANNKKEINELRNANKLYLAEYSKGLKDNQKVIKEEEENQKKLTEELRAGNISRSVYNQLIGESNAQIQKSQSEIAKLSSEFDVNSRAIALNEERIRNLSTENRGLSTSYQAVINAQNGLLDNYSIEGKSVQELREDNLKLINVRNQIATATDGESEEIKKLNALIDENTRVINANVSGDEKRIMNIGRYKESILDAFDAIKSGDFEGGVNQIKELANGAGQAIGSMTKQAIAFIATPIGAAIAGIAAIGVSAKYVFDFNQGLQESNEKLRSLGVNSGEISKVRSELQATADTFGKEFDEIATKANSLAQSYGISISEANRLIQEGLANGGAANAEFLDSLSEYDVMFQKAGFSAQEFINVINEGNSLGIYADKLPDAIKEAGLALDEQTKATKDALVNAFGASFSEDILKKVRTGEITTKEALASIASEAEKSNLNQQQLAQLTADVFKGAGEDAGGALVVLKAISNSAKTELSDVAKAQMNLAKANEDYNKAQARLFEIEGFGTTWANIKTQALGFFTSVLDYISDFRDSIQPLIDIVAIVLANAWQSLKTNVSVVFDVILGGFKVLGNTISTFVNVFKALFQGDFQGALNAVKQGFLNFFNIISNTFAKIKNTIIDGILGIVDNVSPVLSALGIDVDKLSKKLESFKSKIPESKKVSVEATVSTTNTERNITKDNAVADPKELEKARKKIEEAKKIEMEAQQKQIELLRQASEEKIKLAQSELTNYIMLNSSKLANEKILTQSLIEEEKKRLDYISEQRRKQLEDELRIKKESIDKEIQAEQEKQSKLTGTQLENSRILVENKKNELVTLQSEYYGKDLQIKQETEKAKKDIDLAYDSQTREQKQLAQAVEFEQRLIDLQMQGASEYAIKQEQLNQQYALELEKYAQDITDKFNLKIGKDEEQYTIEQEILMQRQALEQELAVTKDAEKVAALQTQLGKLTVLEKTYADNKKQITEQSEAARLSAIQTTLGNVQGLFKQNTAAFKAIAIAQTTIDTYKAAVSAYAAGLQIGGPAGLIAAPIAAGAAIASGLANIANISGVKFGRGGLPEGPSHEDGGIPALVNGKTPIEIEGGEAIINKKSTSKFKSLLSAINQDQGGVAFAGGGIPGMSSIPGVQDLTSKSFDMDSFSSTIEAAVERGSNNGTATGSQKGISDLNTNLKIENDANF